MRVLAFQREVCIVMSNLRQGRRAAGKGWGRVVRKNRGKRCKELWKNDGDTRAAYWEARR